MGQGVRRSTIPTRDYQKKRREIRSRKGTTATAWMRHMVRKIMQGDADGAEKFWHVNRIGGRDLEDLRQASKALMGAYNEAGRWVEVLRKFIGDRSPLRPFTGREGGKSEMGIDGEILDLCFKALLERSDYEIILTLFYQYEPSIKLTPETWEYVLAAYVNLGRFKRAQGLIRYTVFREISISPRCYSVLLSSIRADGSWEKIVRHFNWLEKITRSKVPAIYHIMIQTAMERGMKGEANKYLKRMTDRGLCWTAEPAGPYFSAGEGEGLGEPPKNAYHHGWPGIRHSQRIF
ncbi:hypothetical protein L211DRAFT_850486 [Terfezia boudieri ATCC MYA-4762]|uniref:Pentatricopeptide repeat-containing protein n=1 Tax=Terfezia boudieri ATCC MYA-4762 TaxID=1051890 RepID=A0A3N4LN57_9PEZI|nr:hypothetical protein L211DRAFT_850486 [Terfezia boudieri ATCC MYA-4762]